MPISSGTVRTGVTAVRYESVVGKESRPPITIRFTGWAVAAKRLGCGSPANLAHPNGAIIVGS